MTYPRGADLGCLAVGRLSGVSAVPLLPVPPPPSRAPWKEVPLHSPRLKSVGYMLHLPEDGTSAHYLEFFARDICLPLTADYYFYLLAIIDSIICISMNSRTLLYMLDYIQYYFILLLKFSQVWL